VLAERLTLRGSVCETLGWHHLQPMLPRELPMTPRRRRMIEDMQVRNLASYTQDICPLLSQIAEIAGSRRNS